MGTSFAAVFLASLLGSGHCVGMCGGLAAFCGGVGSKEPGLKSLIPTIAYNFGRLFSYSVLGALAGLLGQSINLIGNSAGIQQTALLASGFLLVVAGVAALFGSKPSQLILGKAKSSALVMSCLKSEFVRSLGAPQRAAGLGLLSAALPCGWLWAFVVLAAGSGSSLTGAGIMAAFWLGSLPALTLVGSLSQLLKQRLQHLSPKLSAAFLIVAGLVFLSQHVNNLGYDLVPGNNPFSQQSSPPPLCH